MDVVNVRAKLAQSLYQPTLACIITLHMCQTSPLKYNWGQSASLLFVLETFTMKVHATISQFGFYLAYVMSQIVDVLLDADQISHVSKAYTKCYNTLSTKHHNVTIEFTYCNDHFMQYAYNFQMGTFGSLTTCMQSIGWNIASLNIVST